jgi:hypothetical protein
MALECQFEPDQLDNPAISFIELVIVLATDNMNLFPEKVIEGFLM